MRRINERLFSSRTCVQAADSRGEGRSACLTESYNEGNREGNRNILSQWRIELRGDHAAAADRAGRYRRTDRNGAHDDGLWRRDAARNDLRRRYRRRCGNRMGDRTDGAGCAARTVRRGGTRIFTAVRRKISGPGLRRAAGCICAGLCVKIRRDVSKLLRVCGDSRAPDGGNTERCKRI